MMPFGIGFSEVMLILVVTLLVVGPKKLPEIAKTLGKGIRTLRRAGAELRDAIELEDIRRTVQDPMREAKRAVTEWTDPYSDVSMSDRKPDPPPPRPALQPPPGIVAQGEEIEDAELIEEPAAKLAVEAEAPEAAAPEAEAPKAAPSPSPATPSPEPGGDEPKS